MKLLMSARHVVSIARVNTLHLFNTEMGLSWRLQDAGRLLPPSIHATTLTTREHAEQTKRIVIVGDVHGCLDEMQELLAKVNFTSGPDLLLFNGDMVNKGPHSVKVGVHAKQSR